MSTVAVPEGHPFKGVMLVMCAVFLFALSDSVGKRLVMIYPVPVVMAVRYIISVSLLTLILLPRLGRRLWQTQRTELVLIRGLCLALASLTMGLALQVMPVGETVAIMYLNPFAVMLVAIPLLGERVSLSGWLGAIAGFAGVLLIVRPGNALDSWGVTMALTNAALATTYVLLTRMLSHTETTIAMLFHTSLVGAIFFSLMAGSAFGQFHPDLTDVGLMVLLGVLSTAGHFLLTAAYREAPASMLAPVNYSHLFWAALMGWLFFNHIPDNWSLAGMLLVGGAGVATALHAHFEKMARKKAIRAALQKG